MPTGLNDSERKQLVANLAAIVRRAGVDEETVRRTKWLLWHLRGQQPVPYTDILMREIA